jgi:hypothetical protein
MSRTPIGTPSPALTTFLADANQPDALVARLDRLFLHGTMSAAMRKTIVNAVNKLPPRIRCGASRWRST